MMSVTIYSVALVGAILITRMVRQVFIYLHALDWALCIALTCTYLC